MPEYRVTYSIEVVAESPEHAARIAHKVVTDRSETQTWSYEVTTLRPSVKLVEVDRDGNLL